MSDLLVIADRTYTYAPPPWRMFEALTDEVERWIELRPRMVVPLILEATRSASVRWGTMWPSDPRATIEFNLGPDGAGAAVRYVAYASNPLDDRGIGLVRHHLAQLFGGRLRRWVDTGY